MNCLIAQKLLLRPIMALGAVLAGCLFSPADDALPQSKHQDLNQPDIAMAEEVSGATNPVISSEVRRDGDIVEFELASDRPFRVGAMPAVLVIGDKAFSRSHHPRDGSLHTLVFVIDGDEYDALSPEASVSFGYLSSNAELETPPRDARGRARIPKIRPDQVREPRLRVGVLQRSRLEVLQ